jgi:aryl-alcohol dehydrogenase-like predicted oxidoreductase
VLTGKYDAGGGGRASGQDLDPYVREAGRRLRAVAGEAGVNPPALAIAFALANPAVATVLFGATSPAQIAENVRALEIDPEVALRLLTLDPPVDQEPGD